MKKRVLSALVVLLFLVGMLAIGVAQQEECKAEKIDVCVEQNDVLTVNTTIINSIDESIDTNTIRIEQMFVIDTYIDEDTNNFVSVLEDNNGYVWECVNMDLYLYEDVLVLMSNNNTVDTIEDDVFIHYWIGIE
jgi:hypothetical protein